MELFVIIIKYVRKMSMLYLKEKKKEIMIKKGIKKEGKKEEID